MTPETLAAIKARCEAATPGPWKADGCELYVHHSREWVGETLRPDDPRAPRDAEFIAHAREDVPALVDALDRLGRELWAATQRCHDCLDHWKRTRTVYCDRCSAALDLLRSLGYGEAMCQWADE